jgi:hypothetical protein
MRIAFDLDDTLIPCSHPFPVEPRTRRARWLGCEPLRCGAAGLLRDLRALGCELWVYTTSLRDPWGVRLLFWCYGVRVQGVVNGHRHARRLRDVRFQNYRHCSKYPPAFGVDLLVDDLEGVCLEGRRCGFRVLRVSPQDEGWAERVRAEAGRSLGR